MHSTITIAVAAALAIQALAKTIPVGVGEQGLTFSPNVITAETGDVLEFHFNPLNHSVAMGDFTRACEPAAAGGFFSGFVPVAAGQTGATFRVTLTSNDPLVFYCTQNTKSHCQNGMFGIVNPSEEWNVDTYGAAAKKSERSISPGSVFGGVLEQPGSSTTSAAPGSSTGIYTGPGNGNGNGNGNGTETETGPGTDTGSGTGSGSGTTTSPGVSGTPNISSANGSLKAGLGGLACAMLMAVLMA